MRDATETRAMLADQLSRLEECVRENRECDADRTGRCTLDVLNVRATRFVRRIRNELERGIEPGPYGSYGTFGPNGHGPAIDNIISDSAIQRRLASVGQSLDRSREWIEGEDSPTRTRRAA